MYLSKIEIIGFKSFAQRVNVNFDSGVTAIVGPNGCGKTNIVDAIRWALGEQRYSTLRSDKMEDVIFNGTKNRKALGLAEVSLTIENTKGILPTEYSEVTITRRVFRSGESEYLLNKTPCRLKDILDLFMDTGMGSDAYSVIELKMVETILSDKTDERRKLFEEAAGVTKYKHRRKAAIRKLEDVQKDLARVNDIVKEVQKTVNSLERQAKKAEQYNEVSNRLKTLEIDLLEREYAYLHNKVKPLEEKFALATSDRSAIDVTLRQQEEHIDHLRGELEEIEKQLGEAQRNVGAKSAAVHRIEEKILVANERKSSLTDNIERYTQEKADLQQQEIELRQERVTLIARRDHLTGELAATEAIYAKAKEEQHLAAENLEYKKLEVQTLKDDLLAVAHEIVEQRGEQERVKTRIDNLRGRIERAQEDCSLYEGDIKSNHDEVVQLTAQDRDLRKKFVEAEMQLFEREQSKKEIRRELDALEKQAFGISHEIERKRAKIEFLQRVIGGNEGLSGGMQYLLQDAEWKKKKFITVADIIQTSSKYRASIEAALADVVNMIVADTMEDGYGAIEALKKLDRGKASFICLQWLPKVKRLGKKRAGFPYVRASDVVECNPKYRPLVNFLLDDVILVDAIGIAPDVFSHVAGIRCVSLDGQIASSTGMLRGGGKHQGEGELIGKRAQIEELEQESAALQHNLDALKKQRDETHEKFERLEIKPFADAVKATEKEMTAIEMRIAQREFEKKRANDGLERNRAEAESLEGEVAGLQLELQKATDVLSTLEERKASRESKSAVAEKELETCELQWNECSKSVSELEGQVVTMRGDLRNTGHDIERTDARLNDISVTLLRRDEEITRAQEEIARLVAENDEFVKNLAVLRSELAQLGEQKRSVETLYTTRRNELHQVELKIKDERRLHDDAVAQTHELEMKISEIKSNIEHLKMRAQEEFELELQLKGYPEDEWVDFAQLREEVKNLKERIRILGAINFAAFDEFTTESERLTFLTQQRDDLIDAEKTLLDTIEEINATAQRIFLETFVKIRENFISIFKELFMEGDESDLKLEDEVDPLEARIEITAKPRGKRPTSIDLLSGGEKTLTAIALLFAIYLVKPSPFCILDEVDAPLDDSNIDRYTRILKKFSGNTQFIVVTHNKRTMEAAHALYGITMEEEGVSKIVTVRFNEEARVRSATVTH